MPATPTRTKKRLGKFLRNLRERAGATLEDAARELLSTDSTISKYEGGLNRPSWPSVSLLLTRYGATEDERDQALALWKDASASTPKVRLPKGTPKPFREFVRAERDATVVKTIAPIVLPGLLQSEGYARAVHAAAQRNKDQVASVDAFVAARLSRQLLLDPPNSLEVHALIDEAALRREVGGPKAMRDHLQHLNALGEKPNVTIQMVPFSAGAYGSMSGACVILDFDDDQPITYLEHPAGGVWVDNEDDVQHFLAMFEGVRAKALSPTDSARFIRAQAGLE